MYVICCVYKRLFGEVKKLQLYNYYFFVLVCKLHMYILRCLFTYFLLLDPGSIDGRNRKDPTDSQKSVHQFQVQWELSG